MKVKKVLKTVFNVFLWLFLLFALAMTILAFSAQSNKAGFPRIGDTCILTVQSDSMAEPGGFYAGDLIISKVPTLEQKQNLEVGDVVTFYMDLDPNDNIDHKELNSHRIIEVIKDENGVVSYATKGDHNQYEDEKIINWSAVEALWTGKRLAGVGTAINFLQSSTGFLVCIVIPLILFFLWEVFQVVTTILKIKNKGKRQITQEDEELIKQRAIEEFLKSQADAQSAPAEPEAPAEDAPAAAEPIADAAEAAENSEIPAE